MKTLKLTILLSLGLAFGFWMYGMLRTMQETVGFNLLTSFRSIGALAVMSLPIVLLLIWGGGFILGAKTKSRTLLIFSFYGSLMLGAVASECSILRDELNFSQETQRSSPRIAYNRPRSWPNEAAMLVFVPDKGIHATD